jgi:hypothetical protein
MVGVTEVGATWEKLSRAEQFLIRWQNDCRPSETARWQVLELAIDLIEAAIKKAAR